MDRMFRPRWVWMTGWFACGLAGAVAAQELPVPPAQALAAYVAKPDATYTWRIQRRYEHDDADVIELHLESQTWKGTLWKHQLLIFKPKRVRDPGHALLIVGGGRWRDSYESETEDAALPEEAALFVAMAQALRSTVVVIGQVPFQPLFDLSEDRLIAHTFDRYLATGDTEWPLLLPMVKSAVRAMDAGSAAASREWGTPLERFTVLGGSKRGWTTWLTAAVEPRVTALAPVVIDALNMERHFPHQTEVWGAPSEEIRPYTDLNLTEVLGSAAGAELRRIVDPWSYRAAIVQPKLVILATNDAYFPFDSANLYWDGLVGPKYLLYVPNEPHSIQHFGAVIRGLRALHGAAGGGESLPELAWEYVWEPAGLTLCVRSAPESRRLRVWRAVSADRDFRDAIWSVALSTDDSPARLALARPESGYSAVFVEATYHRGQRAFALSTNLAVLPAAAEPAFGTEPKGEPGVCAAGPSAPLPIGPSPAP
jgi:PhoPQ-activated pathogenicity-related protein